MKTASWGRAIERRLRTERMGHPLVALEEVDSTNDVARDMALAGGPEGLAVIAARQRKGRGRRGRSWHSARGMGVWMSVVLRPPLEVEEVGWLALVGGLAVADAMERVGLKGVHIKWPNDVLVRKRKVAGVLVEPRGGRGRIDFAVLGIGVNVRQKSEDWTDALKHTATSCLMEGVAVSCEDVAVRVLEALDRRYEALVAGQGARLVEEWSRRSGTSRIPATD